MFEQRMFFHTLFSLKTFLPRGSNTKQSHLNFFFSIYMIHTLKSVLLTETFFPSCETKLHFTASYFFTCVIQVGK